LRCRLCGECLGVSDHHTDNAKGLGDKERIGDVGTMIVKRGRKEEGGTEIAAAVRLVDDDDGDGDGDDEYRVQTRQREHNADHYHPRHYQEEGKNPDGKTTSSTSQTLTDTGDLYSTSIRAPTHRPASKCLDVLSQAQAGSSTPIPNYVIWKDHVTVRTGLDFSPWRDFSCL